MVKDFSFLFDVRFQLSRFALGMKSQFLFDFEVSRGNARILDCRFKHVLRSTRLLNSRSTSNPIRSQSDSVVDKESLAKTGL